MALNLRSSTWLLVFACGSSWSLGCGSDDGGQPTVQAGSPGTGAAAGTASGGASGATSATGGTVNRGGSAGTSTSEGGVGGELGTGDTSRGGKGGSAQGGSATGGGTSGGSVGTAGRGGNSGTGGAAIPDEPCESARDCSDPNNAVCDPVEAKCQPIQCNQTLSCAADAICIGQHETASGGACYDSCIPFGAACSGGRECMTLYVDASEGVCVTRGTAGEGEECTSSNVNTGCATGLICLPGDDGTSVCKKTCNFFGTSNCGGELRCQIGICEIPEKPADPAGYGEPCASAAPEGTACADDGKKIGGICLAFDEQTTCSQLCASSENACGGPSLRCVPFQDLPELGFCMDLGVCGDGGSEHPDCGACLDAETTAEGCCSGIAESCDNEPECVEFGVCLQDCGESPSDECLLSCINDYPNGVPLFSAFLECTTGLGEFVGACGTVCSSGE